MLSSTFVAQDKTSISAMLFLYVQRRAAQQCVQRTPLARPLTWARFFGVVACCRSSRSTEVASSAADAWRWASNRSRSADVGEPNIPGIFPGSRAYRAAGHISGQPGIFPDSRAYRAAGHISRQPDIFPGNRAYFRATGHISGQPGIFPGSRTAGQPGIPGNRAYRATAHVSTHMACIFFADALIYLFG